MKGHWHHSDDEERHIYTSINSGWILPSFIRLYSLQACCLLQLIKYVNKAVEKGAKVADEVALLFTGELNPVAPKAQKKVPVPDG